MSIDNGGPAFPEVFTDMKVKGGAVYGNTYSVGGMTLRDWFANSAKEKHFEKLATRVDRVKDSEYLDAALMAYKEADAMIKARRVNHG